jgi:hypothetical protein
MDGELIVLMGIVFVIITIFCLIHVDRYENEEGAEWWAKR